MMIGEFQFLLEWLVPEALETPVSCKIGEKKKQKKLRTTGLLNDS